MLTLHKNFKIFLKFFIECVKKRATKQRVESLVQCLLTCLLKVFAYQPNIIFTFLLNLFPRPTPCCRASLLPRPGQAWGVGRTRSKYAGVSTSKLQKIKVGRLRPY
jgi:hypothetical protein